jgi:hypothetical protein
LPEHPNLIAPPRPKRGGLSDKRRDPPYLDALDVAFIAQKRAEGCTDNQIAKMMGCSVERVRRNVVVTGEAKQPDPPKASGVPYVSPDERRRRDAEARNVRAWHAPPRR